MPTESDPDASARASILGNSDSETFWEILIALFLLEIKNAGPHGETRIATVKIRDGKPTRVGGKHGDAVDPRSGRMRLLTKHIGPDRTSLERALLSSRALIEALKFGKVQIRYLGKNVKRIKITITVRPLDIIEG